MAVETKPKQDSIRKVAAMDNGRRSPRLILIEFNELCPPLLDRFMDQGLLPNFRRLHQASTVFTTDAAEPPRNLEPWIQWPTVHSGMTFEEHGVFHLGDGKRLRQKCLGEVLSDAGVPVGICMSMNLNYRNLRGYTLPDPWDTDGAVTPPSLEPFYRVVSRQVQESSKEAGLSAGELRAFGTFLLRHGLTLRTVRRVVRQLLEERRDRGVSWRRASLLDHLGYDVFRSLNRSLGVEFATFFANSTAHYQHYFWRELEPELFTVKPPESSHRSLREAIPHGYRSMDVLLGRFLEDYPDSTLVLCTALSQQPWTETTKCTFRPRDFGKLLAYAGVELPATAVKPVMAEQFHLQCPDAQAATAAAERLQALSVEGQPLMSVKREEDGLFVGCRLTDPAVLARPIQGGPGEPVPMGNLFHIIHSMRSGHHHPEGALWIGNGRHEVVETRVPLTAVAPTILARFGVTPPAHMKGQALPV